MKRKEKIIDDDHEAMAEAVNKTLSAVVGSSITTVAGFVALLLYGTYKLGMDLGYSYGKGSNPRCYKLRNHSASNDTRIR